MFLWTLPCWEGGDCPLPPAKGYCLLGLWTEKRVWVLPYLLQAQSCCLDQVDNLYCLILLLEIYFSSMQVSSFDTNSFSGSTVGDSIQEGVAVHSWKV